MLIGLLVGCEVAFWALLLLGLVLRYVVRARRASTIVLASVPAVDLVLVTASAIDLARGSTPGQQHYLASVYLGFSVAFGPTLLRWADVRFAHRFAGGPPPAKLPKRGPEKQRHLWHEWFRVVAAVAIASLTMVGLSLCTDDRAELLDAAGGVWVLAGIWLVAGPLWQAGTDRATSA